MEEVLFDEDEVDENDFYDLFFSTKGSFCLKYSFTMNLNSWDASELIFSFELKTVMMDRDLACYQDFTET